MPDPTRKSGFNKPVKPHPDFPLTAHPTGRWCKKVRGKLHYFGPWKDPQGALELWLSQKDALIAGRTPGPTGEGPTVRDLVNSFLTAKRSLMASKELTSRSFQDYYATAERVVKAFGIARLVSDLRPADFDAYRERTAAKWGPHALANEIQRVRSFFKFGLETGLLEKPQLFGPHFRKPKRREMRLARAAMPVRLFSAAEIRLLLKEAKPQMRAMILLGINCAIGNTDVAELQLKHFDLDKAMVDYPRPKTGIARRAPLWLETIKAIRKAMKIRPSPKSDDDSGCVFITKYGTRWKRIEIVEEPTTDGKPPRIRRRETDAVGLEFGKMLRRLRMKREGVNFYALRHVFETVAGETGDQPAVDRIMGHEDAGSMSPAYREWRKDGAEDARLRRVTDHVRTWLFGKKAKPK